MPRDRDGDEYEYVDRRGGSSGTKTVLIVLGVLGGLFVLGIIGCVGFFGYFAYQASGTFGDMIGSTTSAESFVEHLHGGRVEAAYNGTSSTYKSQTSRAQFDELIKKYPLLTKHAYHTTTKVNMALKTGSKKTNTLEYTLFESGTLQDDAEDPDDEGAAKTKPKPVNPKKEKEAEVAQPKTLVITLTLVEENGQWLVEKLIVP